MRLYRGFFCRPFRAESDTFVTFDRMNDGGYRYIGTAFINRGANLSQDEKGNDGYEHKIGGQSDQTFASLQDLLENEFDYQPEVKCVRIETLDAAIAFVRNLECSCVLAEDQQRKWQLFIPRTDDGSTNRKSAYAKIDILHNGNSPGKTPTVTFIIQGTGTKLSEKEGECASSASAASSSASTASSSAPSNRSNECFIRQYSLIAKCFGADVAESGANVLLIGTEEGDVFWIALNDLDIDITKSNMKSSDASAEENDHSLQLHMHKLGSFHRPIEGFELLDLHPHMSFSELVDNQSLNRTSFSTTAQSEQLTGTGSASAAKSVAAVATHLAIAVRGGEVALLGIDTMCGLIVGDERVLSIHSDPEAQYIGYFSYHREEGNTGDTAASSSGSGGAFVTLNKGLLYVSSITVGNDISSDENQPYPVRRGGGIKNHVASTRSSSSIVEEDGGAWRRLQEEQVLPAILVSDPTSPFIVSCVISRETGTIAVTTVESAEHIILKPGNDNSPPNDNSPEDYPIDCLRRMLCPQQQKTKSSKSSKDTATGGSSSSAATAAAAAASMSGSHTIMGNNYAAAASGKASTSSNSSRTSAAGSSYTTIAQIRDVIEEIDSLVSSEGVLKEQIGSSDMEIRQLTAMITLMDPTTTVDDSFKQQTASSSNTSSGSNITKSRYDDRGVLGFWKSQITVSVVLKSELSIGGEGLGGGTGLLEIMVCAMNRTAMTALHGRVAIVRCQNVLLYSGIHGCGAGAGSSSHSCELVFAPGRLVEEPSREPSATENRTFSGSGAAPRAGATTSSSTAVPVEQFVCRFIVPVFIDTLAPHRVSIDVIMPHVASDFNIQRIIGEVQGGVGAAVNSRGTRPLGIGMQPNEPCGTLFTLYETELPITDITRVLGTECVRANNMLKNNIKSLARKATSTSSSSYEAVNNDRNYNELAVILPTIIEDAEGGSRVSATALTALKSLQQATDAVAHNWASASTAQTNSTTITSGGGGVDILSALTRPPANKRGNGERGSFSSYPMSSPGHYQQRHPALVISEDVPTLSIRTTRQAVDDTPGVSSSSSSSSKGQPAVTAVDICELHSNSPKLLSLAHSQAMAAVIESLEKLQITQNNASGTGSLGSGGSNDLPAMAMNSQQLAMLTSFVPTNFDTYSLPNELQQIMVYVGTFVREIDADCRNEQAQKQQERGAGLDHTDKHTTDTADTTDTDIEIDGGVEYVRTKIGNLWQLYRQLRSVA